MVYPGKLTRVVFGLMLGLTAAWAMAKETHGPVVTQVGFLGSDLVELMIQDGHLQRQVPVPYVAQPGDKIVEEGKRVLVWQEGKMVEGAIKRILQRVVGSQTRNIGYLVGGRHSPPMLLPVEVRLGAMLNVKVADQPETYGLSSAEDQAMPP